MNVFSKFASFYRSSFSEPFEMNGLFNASFNAPTANVFGAIGTQAPLLSSSSSTTSTNSDPMDTLLWLGAIGNALPSSTSSLASYSPPSTDEFSSATMPYIAENQGFGNVCGNCEGPTPENLCFDCSDSLCNRCVLHHLSHFPYKHHTIQKITKTSSPMVGRLASNFAPSSPPRTKIDSDNQCDMHYEVMRYVCEHCKIIVCQECTFRDHKDHQCTSIDKYVERPQTTIKILMDKGASGKQQIKQSIDRILQFTQHMERDANEIIQRTRKNGMRHNLGGNGLRKEEQDRALADIIEKFRQQKLSNFHDKTSGLRAALAGIATVTDDLKKLLNKLDDLSQFQMAKTLIESDHKIEHFLKQTRKLSPSPVNVNHFVQSIDINGSGGIGGVGSAEESIVAGLQRMMQPNVGLNMSAMTPLSATSNPLGLLSNNNSSKAIRRPITRNNRSYHNNNQQNLMQSSAFNALPGISNWSTNLLPNNDLITFPEAMHFNTSPPRFGMAVNRVNGDEPRAFGQCIFNSEAPVAAVQRLKPSHSFAYDGSLEGQLSRPWGVCVDKAGNIIIGDRRNNRIQIFYPDGTFKFAFGTKGSGDGQLELPAGVTTDRQNRIIVADKDNHRIQIFSSAGRFILKFGSYGRDLGEFQYPWDVAVNSIGNIIATDTRNHRIQMFTSNGHFITKYSFDSAYYEKHLKSHITPRGLAFTPSGDILVTDFENHRIMKLDGNLTMVNRKKIPPKS